MKATLTCLRCVHDVKIVLCVIVLQNLCVRGQPEWYEWALTFQITSFLFCMSCDSIILTLKGLV